VVPNGDYAKESDIPSWMRTLMPEVLPKDAVIIDLRALRPYQRYFRLKLPPQDQWDFRRLVNGYDAIVFLPHARPADFKLTGFPEMRGN
jgi:hypothetical protein